MPRINGTSFTLKRSRNDNNGQIMRRKREWSQYADRLTRNSFLTRQALGYERLALVCVNIVIKDGDEVMVYSFVVVPSSS